MRCIEWHYLHFYNDLQWRLTTPNHPVFDILYHFSYFYGGDRDFKFAR